MAHPLVVALFPSASSAAAAARALHALGVDRDRISVVSRSHDEEGALARQMDATPGVEIEDSRAAARLGELSGQVLAAIAMVLPGVGPIVTAGPLSADLGEAAGHAAGSLSSALASAGVPEARAAALQKAVESGSVLLGAHTDAAAVPSIRAAFEQHGASDVAIANWSE